MGDKAFDRWMDELNEDVIQGEYGYEEGEFTAYPALWRPLYEQGLTPLQAFRKALDANADERRQKDEERRQNWERIRLSESPVPTSTEAGDG